MKKSKKLFVAFAIVFFLIVLVVGYDISRKTSFPGSKKYLKESILPSEEPDSERDSTAIKADEKSKSEQLEIEN